MTRMKSPDKPHARAYRIAKAQWRGILERLSRAESDVRYYRQQIVDQRPISDLARKAYASCREKSLLLTKTAYTLSDQLPDLRARAEAEARDK